MKIRTAAPRTSIRSCSSPRRTARSPCPPGWIGETVWICPEPPAAGDPRTGRQDPETRREAVGRRPGAFRRRALHRRAGPAGRLRPSADRCPWTQGRSYRPTVKPPSLGVRAVRRQADRAADPTARPDRGRWTSGRAGLVAHRDPRDGEVNALAVVVRICRSAAKGLGIREQPLRGRAPDHRTDPGRM